MIPEHAHAALTRHISEHGLKVGDVGVVVDVQIIPGGPKPAGYMLEIFTIHGESVNEISVPADALRPATSADRIHARPVAAE
jgi:hypothetical protein